MQPPYQRRAPLLSPPSGAKGPQRLRVAAESAHARSAAPWWHDALVSELAVAVVSVARTRRRRFQWAAWWTSPPQRHPFRKPDAHGGGSLSREDALRDAERVAGRSLNEIEPRWAQAWSRVMQGEPAFPAAHAAERPARRPSPTADVASCWTVLGVAPDATLAEVKRAYRQRALATHPDRGGDPAAFRELQRAHERALARRRRPRRGRAR
jgi:hypothetical protein